MFLFIIISLIQILNANELDNQFNEFHFAMANKTTEFNGKLYCATGNGYDGGLYVKSNEYWKLFQDKALLNNAIRDLIVIDAHLFIATDKGMYFLDTEDKITEINKGLTSDIKNRNLNRVLKIQKFKDSLYINIDNKLIYYSDISDVNKIEWKVFNTESNEKFYDFAIFKDEIFISFLNSGLKKINLESKNVFNIPQLAEEFILRLFTSEDNLVAVSVLENLISTDGLNWENFNTKFNLSSDIIKYFYQSGDKYYFTDNSNLYTSINRGESWSNLNISLQLKNFILTLDIFELNDNIYISTNDFGVLKISNNELTIEKIFNYKTGKFLKNEDDIYYNISTLNFSYIYKNDESEQSFLIFNDTIIDYDIEDGFVYALTQFNGLIKTNGEIEEIIKLPENYDMNLYNIQKIKVIDSMVFLFNGVSKSESKPTMCYISKDKGETWEENHFVTDTTLGCVKINNELYIIDQGEFSARITHYDFNTDTWDIVSGIDKLDAMIFDDKVYYLIDGQMYYFDRYFEQVGSSENKINKMISKDYALFDDSTIKYLNGEKWETAIPLNFLEEYNINDIIKVEEEHLRLGTTAYGIFDLYFDKSSVNNKFSEIFYIEENLITSDELFNLSIFDINGKLLENKNNIYQYDIYLLKEDCNILVFQIGKNIIIKKYFKI